MRKYSENKYGSDIECYNTEDNAEARILAAKEYLLYELKFHEKDIKISEARLVVKENSKILWITSTKDDIQRIYRRAALMTD